jgi:hypothetical protein
MYLTADIPFSLDITTSLQTKYYETDYLYEPVTLPQSCSSIQSPHYHIVFFHIL